MKIEKLNLPAYRLELTQEEIDVLWKMIGNSSPHMRKTEMFLSEQEDNVIENIFLALPKPK